MNRHELQHTVVLLRFDSGTDLHVPEVRAAVAPWFAKHYNWFLDIVFADDSAVEVPLLELKSAFANPEPDARYYTDVEGVCAAAGCAV